MNSPARGGRSLSMFPLERDGKNTTLFYNGKPFFPFFQKKNGESPSP
jgi:hypothetical protein